MNEDTKYAFWAIALVATIILGWKVFIKLVEIGVIHG